nr:hypothetical protein CDL12_11840 [Ipomoea trifida]
MAFSPISADEVFCNGQIRPIFPVHKRNLSTGDAGILCRNSNSSCMQAVKARLPLRKLLIEGRETSESDSDPGPGAEETYCVWEPKLGDDAGDGGGCTKSNESSTATTGSSKWWKHLLSTPKRRYCSLSGWFLMILLSTSLEDPLGRRSLVWKSRK